MENESAAKRTTVKRPTVKKAVGADCDSDDTAKSDIEYPNLRGVVNEFNRLEQPKRLGIAAIIGMIISTLLGF